MGKVWQDLASSASKNAIGEKAEKGFDNDNAENAEIAANSRRGTTSPDKLGQRSQDANVLIASHVRVHKRSSWATASVHRVDCHTRVHFGQCAVARVEDLSGGTDWSGGRHLSRRRNRCFSRTSAPATAPAAPAGRVGSGRSVRRSERSGPRSATRF